MQSPSHIMLIRPDKFHYTNEQNKTHVFYVKSSSDLPNRNQIIEAYKLIEYSKIINICFPRLSECVD